MSTKPVRGQYGSAFPVTRRPRHEGTTGTTDCGVSAGKLVRSVDLHIDSSALANYTHIDLQHIIADVINAMRERLMMRGRSLMDYVDQVVGDTVEILEQIVGDTAEVKGDTTEADRSRKYAESSRDGTVALALDQGSRVLWCRLEPEVGQWPADVLADRIKQLYTLARVLVDLRRRSEERLGPKLAAEMFSKPAAASFPDKEALKRYRRDHIDF